MKIYLDCDWIRAVYYDRLHELVHSMEWPYTDPAILEWAECEGVIPKIIREVAPRARLTLAPYPRHDIQEHNHAWGDAFDVVILDQVLEHVPNVFAAIYNCCWYLKKDGYLFCGSPWIYPYHAAPKDYWRISVDAYKYLFDTNGIEPIEISGWGTQEAIVHGNLHDAFLSAGFCVKCHKPKRGDPNEPCSWCGAKEWQGNRTVAEAQSVGLFWPPNSVDHAIEVWAIGRKK